MSIREHILAGCGEIKSDLVLKDCMIVNVNTKEIIKGDIAIAKGFIAGIGDVDDLTGTKTRIYDIKNACVCPGLIDGHVHFESSMITLCNFAQIAMLHGTTGIVIDPHEIANILGIQGIELLMLEAKNLPIDVFFTLSSCVPSSRYETSGANIGIPEIRKFLDSRYVVGLGEVMDYPSVLRGDHDKIGKISDALERKLVVDGHCPGLRGKHLFGYMSAGISSDHESVTYDEILEKARLGMKVMLREGSAAKCLSDFIPQLIRDKISPENFFFVTDDKNPADLMDGYMDAPVRSAIKLGLDPVTAISMASINTARHFRIDQLAGSISIGRRANLVILDDLRDFRIRKVIIRGQIKPAIRAVKYPEHVFRTVRYETIKPDDLKLRSNAKEVPVHVIEIVPGKLITKRSIRELNVENGTIMPDTASDILAISVIERHGISGNIGRGFVHGFGLKAGAIGQSIAHDSHNVILIGTDFEDMALCANKLKELQGGIAAAREKVIGQLPLPFAGILSTESAYAVNKKLKELHTIAKQMGCELDSPFSQMSFLSLPVIPSLKITDKGLVDVDAGRIIDAVVVIKKSP